MGKNKQYRTFLDIEFEDLHTRFPNVTGPSAERCLNVLDEQKYFLRTWPGAENSRQIRKFELKIEIK